MAETFNKQYSRQDLETILKQQEIYLMSPDELLTEHPELSGTKNIADVHEQLFAELHERSIADLRDFIDGKLELAPDALETMESFIATFADGYKAPEMKKLAADARHKLSELKNLTPENLSAGKSQLKKEEAEFNKFLKRQGITAEEFANFSDGGKGIWSNAFRNWQAKEIELKTKARKTAGITAVENNEGIDVLAKKAADKERLKKALAAAAKDKKFRDFLESQGKTIEEFNNFSDGGKGLWLKAFHNLQEQKKIHVSSDAENEDNIIDFGLIEDENNNKNNRDRENPAVIPEHPRDITSVPKKTPEKPKSFWGKIKDKARKWGKKLLWAAGIASGLLLLNKSCSDEKQGESLPQQPVNTTITPPDTVQTPKADPQDMYQIARRLAHQDKIGNPIEAATLAYDYLEKFSKLPQETRDRLPGENNSRKLAKLVVVRGDQAHLKTPIDSLIGGKKISTVEMANIVARTKKVTDDYGAAEEYKQENRRVGPQADRRVTKAMVEKVGQNYK